MVSFIYLSTSLIILLSVVLAAQNNPKHVEIYDDDYYWQRFWHGRPPWTRGVHAPGYGSRVTWLNAQGPIGAYGLYGSYPKIWFKEVTADIRLSRRFLHYGDEQNDRRDVGRVACKDQHGQIQVFVMADCYKAVQIMHSNKTSSATCGTCTVKLATPNGQLAASGVPAQVLREMTTTILQSCANNNGFPTSNFHHGFDEKENMDVVSKRQFAMLFQKGDGTCDK